MKQVLKEINGKWLPITVEIPDEELIPEQIKEQEIAEIEQWFEMYDNQVKQYNRCVRLNIPYDNKYGTIEELDKLAVKKANRLNELKN